MNPHLIPIVDWGLGLYNYPAQLGGCLLLALALILALRANPVSAFTFAFSAWFAMLWAVVDVGFLLSMPLERQSPDATAVLVVIGALSLLFGIPAFLALVSFRLKLPSEDEGRRGVKFFGVLLLAHAGHLFLVTAVAGMAEGS